MVVASSSVATSAKATPTTISTVVVAPTTVVTSAVSGATGATQAKYGQCGGIGWTGLTRTFLFMSEITNRKQARRYVRQVQPVPRQTVTILSVLERGLTIFLQERGNSLSHGWKCIFVAVWVEMLFE